VKAILGQNCLDSAHHFLGDAAVPTVVGPAAHWAPSTAAVPTGPTPDEQSSPPTLVAVVVVVD
jgi:hypothetical protein